MRFATTLIPLFAALSNAGAADRRPQHRADLQDVPIINFHTHPQGRLDKDVSAEALDAEVKTRIGAMDAASVRKDILLCLGFGREKPNIIYMNSEKSAFHFLKAAPERFVAFTTVDFSKMDAPDFTANAVRHLEETVRAGARGLKFELGKPAFHWMPMDDPRLDPLYDKATELGIPIAYHSSDPEEFFYPPNQFNFWLARTQAPGGEKGYSHMGDKAPSREQLHRERENMLRKHPNTTFILVHMAWLSRQLPLLASIMDRYPKVYLDVSACLGELGRGPKESARFLVHYSSRILFGTDGGIRPMTEEAWVAFLERHFAVLETDRDELEPPYRRAWTVHGLNLPAEALRRIYYRNAEELLARPRPQ